MVKKISVDKLQLGMYVCGTDRKWIDLPFFRQKFLLNSEKQIATLQHYCKQVLIDTEKGCDEKVNEEAMPPIIITKLADTFEFDTEFAVVELSSGELGLMKNADPTFGLHIMTDTSRQLLPQADFIKLDVLEARSGGISRLLESHDPLCELLMAVYARTKDAEAEK
jgi:hypothetical protein